MRGVVGQLHMLAVQCFKDGRVHADLLRAGCPLPVKPETLAADATLNVAFALCFPNQDLHRITLLCPLCAVALVFGAFARQAHTRSSAAGPP